MKSSEIFHQLHSPLAFYPTVFQSTVYCFNISSVSHIQESLLRVGEMVGEGKRDHKNCSSANIMLIFSKVMFCFCTRNQCLKTLYFRLLFFPSPFYPFPFPSLPFPTIPSDNPRGAGSGSALPSPLLSAQCNRSLRLKVAFVVRSGML